MKILCVIDSFGSGGAQRQMIYLACGLKERGHNVEMFSYYPQYEFFKRQIEDAGICIHQLDKRVTSSFYIIKSLSQIVKAQGVEAVIAFLNSPSIYVELASLRFRNRVIIVSERGGGTQECVIKRVMRAALHGLASAVVTNNHANARKLQRFPWLKRRVRVIYNGVRVPVLNFVEAPGSIQRLRLIAIGRIDANKNAANVIEALAQVEKLHGVVPSLSWIGRRDDSVYGSKVDRLLAKYPGVRCRWTWAGERSDVLELLNDSHALIHASYHEGLPNAVCEALAAGRPVLASNVCDHPLLVENEERGFLFDPSSPHAIAEAICRLGSGSRAEWERWSSNARCFAEAHLSTRGMVDKFENELTTALGRRARRT